MADDQALPPLAGVRVVELATGLAGPYAALFLADQGADVVKVEPDGGDPYRGDPGFATVNRNKRSVLASMAPVDELMATADVVIVGGPGRIDAVRAAARSAVVVAVSPWGERGPRRDDPITDRVLHAATGIAWNQQSYAEVPVDVVVPIARYATGVLAALAAVTGLVARLDGPVGGPGPTYEVPEVAGAAALQLGEFRAAGPPAVRPADSALGSKGRVACYRLVRAGDDRWFFLACGTARFYHRMLEVIGRTDLADHPDLANPPWGLLSDEAIATLTPILDEAFASRPRDQWLELLAAADVPAQPVLTRDEFRTTSIVTANDMLVTIDDPHRGPVEMMGLPFTVEGAPGRIDRPAPLLGADLDAVRADWLAPDLDRPGQERPETTHATTGRATGAGTGHATGAGVRPLAGLRVVDLASFIAGPVISRHLAMLGADVVKVEPPTGDPFRAIGPMFGSWNQGKRSIAIDLTTDDGRAVVHRLAATADVVVENFRPGVAERLGVDRVTLQGVNPDLVFVSAPGYGADPSMADKPAFDPLVQALGGFMATQGGLQTGPDGRPADDGAEPVFLSVPVHDVVTPMIGALGAVTALWVRRHRGGGQHVSTSLVQSTMVAQAAEYTRFEGRPEPALGGFDHPGPEGHSWYESDDGQLRWRDGHVDGPVCVTGLTGSDLAEANDLCCELDDPVHGRLVVFGQLIGGAGPHPDPPPSLDEHGDQIRSELDDGPPGRS